MTLDFKKMILYIVHNDNKENHFFMCNMDKQKKTKWLVHFWEDTPYRHDKESPSIMVAGKLRSVEVDVHDDVHIPFRLRELGYRVNKIRNKEKL